jgi:hypothetical protein
MQAYKSSGLSVLRQRCLLAQMPLLTVINKTICRKVRILPALQYDHRVITRHFPYINVMISVLDVFIR